MTKSELISITLKQLEERLKTHPECFKLEDPTIGSTTFTCPTIIWQFKVEVDNKIINDPNNAPRTIVVSYNKYHKQLSCAIYMREVNTVSNSIMADATVQVNFSYPLLNKPFHQWRRLRKALIKRHKEKLNIDYLSKLTGIFPDTFEDELLK